MKYGAVSIEVVKEMINGVFNITDAAYAVAVSGIAGPGGDTLEKPIGTVCVAIGKRGEEIDAGVLHLQGNRGLIIEEAANMALCMLYRRIAHNLLYFKK